MRHVIRTSLVHVTLFSLMTLPVCRSWLYRDYGWTMDCPTELSEYILYSYKVPPAVPDRAIKTAHPDFHITTSPIAGLGAFSRAFIPRDTWIGEYEGTCVPQDWRDWQPTVIYMWAVYGADEALEIACQKDGSDPRLSNWLRYINNARNISELNVWPHWCQDKLYYRTTKDIPPYTELLTYYGRKAAESYGIDVTEFEK